MCQVFVHDPLYKWALSPLKALQRQKVTTSIWLTLFLLIDTLVHTAEVTGMPVIGLKREPVRPLAASIMDV